MDIFKSKEMKGATFVCMAAALWGLEGVALIPRLFHFKVPFVVFMVHFIPFLGMSLLFGRTEIENARKLPKSDLFYFFLVALFGGALGTLSIVKALFLMDFHHLTIVTLLQKLQPVFAILLSRVILGERVGKNFIGWALLALVGGYFLTFEFNLPVVINNGNLLKACMLSMFAAFSFGSGTVFGKRALRNAAFRTAVYLRYTFTTTIMLFISVYTGSLGELTSVGREQWAIFLIIGLTSGSGAILLYYYGLRYIKANVATICELAFPISSIIFDYVFNGSVLSPIQWISVFLMIGSIYRLSKNQSQELEVKAA
ncbi:membrane protein [Propionigenium maris DSM 9537]|uniref:Membrane protein n=1 Tax=Propionigenium maris DSM 9537 TaxID=1123000 RepID=A0A9W6GMT8_9FUSO|nr:DMT family transporter [Propionigenium maris]GLI56681.1 membrane protein [Propionigenium maris DSM 9537]